MDWADELIRKGEGLAVDSGARAGDEIPDAMLLTEKGVRYSLDLKTGHQTNFR